jgi:hypothetical protein
MRRLAGKSYAALSAASVVSRTIPALDGRFAAESFASYFTGRSRRSPPPTGQTSNYLACGAGGMIYSGIGITGTPLLLYPIPSRHDGNPFLRDLDACRHLAVSRALTGNFLVIHTDAIRRAPEEVRQGVYEFLGVASDFKPTSIPERTPPGSALCC